MSLLRIMLLPLVALALLTCRDQPTGPPLLAISDAAHGGPNAHFYFLPPLVPAPSYSGIFDGTLSPVVDICPWDGTTCGESIATFDMTTEAGAETVRVVDEHYIVNWHTDEFPVITQQMYRINISADGTNLGYADVVIGADGREAKNLATEETFGLKDGRTLPIKFRIEQGALNGVGPEGGVFVAQDGKVVLDVPAGALAGVTWISVEPTSTFPANITTAPGSVFDFGPEGSEFTVPVTLTLTYDPTTLPTGVDEESLLLAHVVDGVWILMETQVNTVDHTVSGLIVGFSTYGILAPTTPTLSANLAFTSDRDGDHEIYVTDGTVEQKVTDNSVDDHYPDWMGDLMLFVRDGDIYLVPSSGGTATNLTHSSGINETAPNWSPDGTSIAYVRGTPDGHDIFVMNADGTIQRNLTYTPGYDAGPVWSPDGQTIAFHTDRDGDYEVYSMNADGSDQTNLTNDPGMDDSSPAWSPDGSRIVYAKYEAGVEGDLWITDPSGSSHENLTKSSFGLASAPAWSPDGTQIAFTMWGRPPSRNHDVWVIVADGSAAGPAAADPSASVGSPAWEEPAPTVKRPLMTAGRSHTCGLTFAGWAYCWGDNSESQLGVPVGQNSTTPLLVDIHGVFVSLAAGPLHTCGVRPDGKAYCWGANYGGQLGDGSFSDRDFPVQVAFTGLFESLTAGEYHTCGLTTNGTAYCWGANFEGQLGDGSTSAHTTPVPVAFTGSFALLTAGENHTCGLTSGGAAYCWGSNSSGQLGIGSSTGQTTPAAVDFAESLASLTAGRAHTCGLTSGGAAYCWGANPGGQLGDGTTNSRSTPVPVGFNGTFGLLATGADHTCGLTPEGTAYCWGANFEGQLGDGTIDTRSTPEAVNFAGRFVSLTSRGAHTCGLTSDPTAYCWGWNHYGQLGNGTTDRQTTPVAVLGFPPPSP